LKDWQEAGEFSLIEFVLFGLLQFGAFGRQGMTGCSKIRKLN
jgi:hypothetical protein